MGKRARLGKKEKGHIASLSTFMAQHSSSSITPEASGMCPSTSTARSISHMLTLGIEPRTVRLQIECSTN